MKELLKFLNLDHQKPSELNASFQRQVEAVYEDAYRKKIFSRKIADDLDILNIVTSLLRFEMEGKVPAYSRYLPT